MFSLQEPWSRASDPVECGGEESLAADPDWWEAVLVILGTPAMSRTSEAADSKMEWNPVMAASAA